MQSSGVNRANDGRPHASSGGLGLGQILSLAKSKRWVVGTILLGVAIVFQLVSLGMAPIMVVQPVGAIALVFTTFMNARLNHFSLNPQTLVAVALCFGGIVWFVVMAASVAEDKPMTDDKLRLILILLGMITAIFAVLSLFFSRFLNALTFVLGAGILYGFVATLAKVVLLRVTQQHFDPLTITCVAVLIVAMALGGWFVQNAHHSGPPDLVMAGLTVIDPLVAVTIGIVVLEEASNATGWDIAGFIPAGLVAVIGVFLVARFHPQSHPHVQPSTAK